MNTISMVFAFWQTGDSLHPPPPIYPGRLGPGGPDAAHAAVVALRRGLLLPGSRVPAVALLRARRLLHAARRLGRDLVRAGPRVRHHPLLTVWIRKLLLSFVLFFFLE